MAKFKKRRSGPVKGKKVPDGPDKTKEGEGSQDPHPMPGGREPEGVEKPEPGAGAERAPPAEPDAGTAGYSAMQQSEKDSKLTQLFWLRVGFAIAAGIAATFVLDVVEGEERRWASIGFMIIVFIATIVIAKGMHIPFALSDRKKLVTQGIGSYIFMYLFVWIMSYSIVNMDGRSALPFP